MADFKNYLAASILTEDKVVTYRLLSRVLKVHVNAAKEYAMSGFVLTSANNMELQLLSDSTREIQTISKTEDPLESYHKYGIITNANTKRRTRKAPAVAVAVAATASVPSRPAAAKAKPNEVHEAPKSSSSSSRKPEPKSQPSSAKDFFGNKGPENAKPKLKLPAESTKLESTSAPSSKETTPAPPNQQSSSKAKIDETNCSAKEDTPMLDDDDDDDEDTWMPAPISKETKTKNATPKTPAEEPEDDEKVEGFREEEPTVTASNGRRKGRRRVMKKRTVKDEDGYLVTKQEQAWNPSPRMNLQHQK
ncbi:hypothetical protein DID88_005416 [Monilinia fructigena]|uniref:DNA polymerase delta subunit 3 n=1 Tax=Monilinia fructigena TaxID=38457 RepID=A0A395IZT1_9HELO|nr:hypothetical protein DID88_005416 [Monilinia fructigena]